MSEYILSCESTVDLTKAHLEKRKIFYIGYPYELNGQFYQDDLGETIPLKDFYHAMEQGADIKTAQINAYEFTRYFEGFLADGKDVLHLCLSSGITGVLNAARMAKAELEEKYPDRHIYLVDSLAASAGSGLLMERLADLRDEGMSIERLWQWVQGNKLRVNHWFFSSDLKYYIRGGRISKTAGTAGTMLGICPLLDINADGRLIPREKIRGTKRAILALNDKMRLLADKGQNYDQACFVAHAGCPELAMRTAELLNQNFPCIPGGVRVYQIGTIIGAHTGPGTVALFFWGKDRKY
ncbi:DegV family protein [Candidatus Pseudoscillospira sp. SGI.172]|uniref:DegV family protein n=1 Tax=Candidatus Pseudoscillospira sp. SGI.172 TaxID=3420582 RepID=UPI0009BA2A42|nr:DegV family protein [Pseudoflavonifractor sp.]MDY3020454.1 DegV family protein [Oscillospiraceae bacterium]